MSMMLMVKAFGIKAGSASRKLVLVKLADNANDKGECWPSYQHIADQCEMSRRAVMTHINALCEAGYVTKRSRKGPKGNSSNIYLITLDSEKPAPPAGKGGENPALDGEQVSLGGENPAPPPGEHTSPGISHSFEPVSEPNPIGPSPSDDAPAEVSTDDAFEVFWHAGMRKANKKKARAAFDTALKSAGQSATPLAFAELLADDVARRIAVEQMGFDKMHPTTYLSGERWEDELPVRQAQPDRKDGRKGFAQPMEVGSYTPTNMDNLPDWAADLGD